MVIRTQIDITVLFDWKLLLLCFLYWVVLILLDSVYRNFIVFASGEKCCSFIHLGFLVMDLLFSYPANRILFCVCFSMS